MGEAELQKHTATWCGTAEPWCQLATVDPMALDTSFGHKPRKTPACPEPSLMKEYECEECYTCSVFHSGFSTIQLNIINDPMLTPEMLLLDTADHLMILWPQTQSRDKSS